MVLKEITIKDGLYYKIKTSKVGKYTKDELYYSRFEQKWFFKKESKTIKKALYGREDHKNVIFIEFEGERKLYGYYIIGLELI